MTCAGGTTRRSAPPSPNTAVRRSTTPATDSSSRSPTSGSALASAIKIQRRLAEHRRAHGFAPQVRMGLHATAATHDGTDYTGLGVHTAARIGALAGAGEISVSVETIAGVPDARTSAPRTAQLKGIAEPVDVVAVEWRDSTLLLRRRDNPASGHGQEA